jgi:hypothetical protein
MYSSLKIQKMLFIFTFSEIMFCKNLKFGVFLGGRDFDTRQLFKMFKAGLGRVLCLLETLQVTDWAMVKIF